LSSANDLAHAYESAVRQAEAIPLFEKTAGTATTSDLPRMGGPKATGKFKRGYRHVPAAQGDLLIEVQADAPERELRDLRDLLARQPELRGRVNVVHGAPPGALGTSVGALVVSRGSGGVVAVLVGALAV
jgi:hypothetical protein